MRLATLGAMLAWIIATGCTGRDSSTEDSGVETPAATSDALVELPPAPPLTSEMPPTPTNELPLGEWDWGAPCRVGVHEVIGTGGPQVARSFTIDVVADTTGGGYVMSFEDIAEQTDGLTEEYVAGALYRNLAVLPEIRLDAGGRFVEFLDLEAGLSRLADRAGVASAGSTAVILARQPVVTESILDRTILGWYGFWIDHTSLPVNPDRLTGERSRQGPAGVGTWSTEKFVAPVVGERAGQAPDGSVWLTHSEQAVDAITGRVDASAIVEPSDRRPSYVVTTINGFTSGGLAVFAEQDRRLVTFDWEGADGCE